MEETSILIVEDDNDINNMLRDLLISNGYKSESAFSGTEAIMRMEKKSFSLVLLDLMLPGLTGEDVLEKIRKNNNETPIIIISAKDDKQSKVLMLKGGADDYITKPFDTDELLARIEALLRRKGFQTTNEDDVVIYKDIILNRSTLDVSINGASVPLTKHEYLILELLMSNPKKVFTKNNIFENVWNEQFFGEDNAINVHISNIRSKLSKTGTEEKYIQTVWGIGFKME